MTTFRPAWVTGLLVIALGCAGAQQADRVPTSSSRAKVTTNAADCQFTMPDGSPLLGESEVDDPPRLLSPGPQVFPSQMRIHGIPGRVTFTYVVGKDGLAVRPSFHVVDATNHAFVPATEEMVYGSRFSPGVHLGAPVATCVMQVLHFTIQ